MLCRPVSECVASIYNHVLAGKFSVKSFMYRALLDVKLLYRMSCLLQHSAVLCAISVLRVQLMASMRAGSGSEQLQGLQSVPHIYTLQHTRDADHFVLLSELWCTMIAFLSPAPVGLG